LRENGKNIADLRKLHDGILNCDQRTSTAVTREALAEGVDPRESITRRGAPNDEILNRYVTAMRIGRPDRATIPPLAAEIAAKYAGFTCQQATHDYRCAFEAVMRYRCDFDWDAVVPNMAYLWAGLTQAIGAVLWHPPRRRGAPLDT
jgi:hypothetical protein